MYNVLITGGAGAIGGNLARRLLKEGHDVTILDDLSSGHASSVPQGARFVKGDILDPKALAEVFATKPRFVFHLAALFANQLSVEHPERDLMVNGLGTLRVLEASRLNQVKKVLYCSSSCIYGAKERMLEDDLERELDTPYAITKNLGEHYSQFWVEQHKLDVVITRLFNSYGPGEMPGRYRNVIPNFFDLAWQKKALVITGTGDETRDFTFVEDTVAGLYLAMITATKPGAVFNLGSGVSTRIRDLAEQINALTGNPTPIEYAPRRGWDRIPHRLGDIGRARAILGYQPSTSLREGLARTWDWLGPALEFRGPPQT